MPRKSKYQGVDYDLRCSCCGRKCTEDRLVIPGREDLFLCEECSFGVLMIANNVRNESGIKEPSAYIQRLAEVVQAWQDEENKNQSADDEPIGPVPTPHAIKAELDKYVIGHDHTKIALSVAVHNHYRRLEQLQNKSKAKGDDEFADVEIEKSNILLVGPTGCGKTLLAKTLAKMLNVPYAIGDATTLTQAGYVGEDVENLVRYLWQNAGNDINRTKRGIIYIDEIDKIASKTDNVSITRDVSGEGVQQALLKILEGSICRIPPKGGRKHPDQELVEIDTSNILFICGGAFVGLDKIIAERTNQKVIGYSSEAPESGEASKDKALDIRPEDLVKFGLIPEFTGRLPVVTSMTELTEDDLVRILTEPKNCLTKQYRKLLAMDNVDLTFEPEALRELARNALKRKTGARGLRAAMERLMMNVMFDAPENKSKKKIVITEAFVKEHIS